MVPQGQVGSMLATSKKEGPLQGGRENYKADESKKSLLRHLLDKMVKRQLTQKL